MKICCVSDLHGYLPEIQECDLLLIGGDICPIYNHKLTFQTNWILNDFNKWLKKIPSKNIVMTPGNHDFIFQEIPEIKYTVNCGILINELGYIQGLKIWGSPWTKKFFDWAFNMSAKNLYKLHSQIPQCDIILTHGPPYGFGDLCWRPCQFKNNRNIKKYQHHEGSPGLMRKILEIEPKLVVSGHIHSGYSTRKLGNTYIVNASYVNEKYKPANLPVILDI